MIAKLRDIWNGSATPVALAKAKGKMTKQDVVDELHDKGVTHTMSESGNKIAVKASTMTMATLNKLLEEAKKDKSESEDKAKKDKSESEDDDSELEVDGSAVEEGAEEEVQDDIDDVIYLAHL